MTTSMFKSLKYTPILITCLFIMGLTAWTSPVLPETGSSDICASPEYYEIKLVGTRKVRGARMARGLGQVSFASSPFGVAISASGTYIYDLHLSMINVNLDADKSLAAWITTPQLDRIRSVGRFNGEFRISAQTDWNKFLVVITLEPSGGELGAIWSGPIVARGMSRSGLMHTMAGHGPFEVEPCVVYGY